MDQPEFQKLLLPLVESLNDGATHSLASVREALQRYYDLTDESLKPNMLGGTVHEFDEAVLLAIQHLVKADLIQQASPDLLQITSFGKTILQKRFNQLTLHDLRNMPGYQ